MWIDFPTVFSARRSFRWHVDVFNGKSVRGWVVHLKDVKSPSVVVALRNGKLKSGLVTTTPRVDLTAAGYGPAAFLLNLNEPCPEIDLVVTNAASRGRWVKIAASLRVPAGVGYIDGIDGNTIRGWAASFGRDSPDVTVVIRSDDKIVAKVRPLLPRPDVAESLMIANHLLGFEVSVPWQIAAFKPLTVAGECAGGEFPIGNVTAPAERPISFAQRFSYSWDERFWL